jgi:hypothetical protein
MPSIVRVTGARPSRDGSGCFAAVVIKSLTGHVTEKMREHYSTVALGENLMAVSSVHRLVPLGGGDTGGDPNVAKKKAREGSRP